MAPGDPASPWLLLLLLVAAMTATATGELRLEVPARPPRVYAGAPSGVDVSVVRAVDDDTADNQQFVNKHRYFLYDYQHNGHFTYFAIDELHGNITTARYLELGAGQEYRVIVVALMSGKVIKQEMTVEVTHYNQHAPKLVLHHYSVEVVVGAEVGTPLMRVQATDDDLLDYNRELRYFLADPASTYRLDPFLKPPKWSPVSIDQESGQVSVAGELQLDASPIRLLVGAVDGGSPQRYTLANFTVYVRNMSEPLGVEVSNTSESTLNVCWSPPAHWLPQGYVLSYTPVEGQRSYAKGLLNLTTAQLHSKLSPSSGGGSEAEGEAPGNVVEIYRYCATVGGLVRWTEYLVGVRAWVGDQVSMAATPILATTRSDYCAEGVCGKSNCTLQKYAPGYSCVCHPGYYGQNCQYHNPCVPVNPCKHFGKCQNASDGSYTCDCLRGFYGPNCYEIDPCTAISSNPCSNGGTCIRRSQVSQYHVRLESGKYTCLCPEGYFGGTCEYQDPCFSSPCQHGGSCINLTDTDFVCQCTLGYRGKLCHAEIDECFPNPCIRGQCTDLMNDFQCKCPKGWGGKICDKDLESCPAHTTQLDTGEFHWPATQHGLSVTLPCPFGVRASATDNVSAGKMGQLVGTAATNIISDDFPTSTIDEKKFLEYDDGSSVHPTVLSPLLGITTQAEWDGGSFYINRQTRSIELTESTQTTIPITSVSEVNSEAVRRQVIAANLRGSHPRHLRRLQQGGQPRKAKQMRRGIGNQTEREQESQVYAEERPGRKQFRYRGRFNTRRFRIPKQPVTEEQPLEQQVNIDKHIAQLNTRSNPIAEPHIGERVVGGQQSLKAEVEKEGKKPDNQSIIVSDTLYRAEKKQYDQQQRWDQADITDSNKFEQQKVARNAEDLAVQASYSEFTKDENKYLENTRRNFYEHLAGDHNFPQVNIDETLLEMPSRTVRKSTDVVLESRKRLNEQMQMSKEIEIGTTTSTLNGRHESLKNAKEENENDSNNHQSTTTPSSSAMLLPSLGAVRFCVQLSNGTVVWKEPDVWMCRGKAMQAAEDAAKDLASFTASPASVNPEMFAHAANQLAKLVEHALHDPAVASSMMSALSNMMEVNDSVVAAGDKKNNVTSQLVHIINTFTENVDVTIGKSVQLRSNNLVLEARMLESSATDITFSPKSEVKNKSVDEASHSRKRRNASSSDPSLTNESFLRLPPQALKIAGKKHVRLEFVSYSNDKFFRGSRALEMPVITAKVTNTVISNLSEPVVYYISTEAEDSFLPRCVFWDEVAHDWSEVGMKTVRVEGMTTCEATHLTAFSVLLDPLPSSFGVHAEALSIITYVGLALSTAGLTATVATYATFRTLNRDRSGKIVMNLSLALLLLNLVFIIATQLEPPSIACTALAAMLHYLVIAAFAWMLVEAANMYQLLITVFASAETHFMAKRVIGAWGVPVIVVVAAIIADVDVYGDKNHGFCVISPIPNSVIYYTTYMGPICCMLLVNCIVFVMVTRVLCQRRPHSHKPKSPSVTTSIEFPITLAQVRGAVTVVALLGVTWVAGAISVGWARQILQYIFCLTTPLQGLIIFIVRVAQHPEARAAWIALFTTGTLRRRPPTHSTHSSAHTHSTSSSALTPPRNYHSSVRTVSTRVSPRGSIKPSSSVKRNGSAKHRSKKNGSIHRYTSNFAGMEASEFSISTIFSRLVHRLGSNDLENHKSKTQEGEINNSTSTAKHVPEIIPSTLPQRDYSSSLNDEANFSDKLLQKTYYHNNKNESLFRPQSLVLLRTDNHGSVLTNHPSTFSKNISHQFPVFLSTNLLSQDLLEAGIPASMMPRRSLGSLTLLTEGKEGDDSSWRFVRPPPDGRSDPVNEESAIEPDKQNISQESKKQVSNIISAAVQSIRAKEPIKSSGCVVLSGQRVATNHLVMFSGERNDVHSSSFLTRANSELQMGSPPINSVELRRSASVYTLGEWEDPRSSLA
ncbi:uncharacterized protein [Cherax quadricarinatus]|uniref:uncharacterized protein isoform X3 n=1 Tax=Cherax quadricarinatus TaxID=27406 RepID=UPI00387EA3D8